MKPLPLLVGVDPGISGGFAVLTTTGEIFAKPFGENFAALRSQDISLARVVVEAQQGTGRRSDFNFGRHCGQLDEIISRALAISEVRPQVWQRPFSVGQMGRVERKRHLLAVAKQLFPAVAARKQITLKTADALLILKFSQQ